MKSSKSNGGSTTRVHRSSLDQFSLKRLAQELPLSTSRRLQSISSRLERIFWLRALCVGSLVGIIATMFAILFDHLTAMSDAQRWLVAAVLFVSTSVALIASLYQRLRNLHSAEWLAQVIESIAPNLRDSLLSSFELAAERLAPAKLPFQPADGPTSSIVRRNGSAEFVDALHSKVADRLETVAPHHVLRWNKVAPLLITTVISLISFVSTFFIPQTAMAHRVARVWLPFVDVGRIVEFELVFDRSEGSWIELRNEVFTVVGRATQGEPRSIDLEILTSEGKRAIQPMIAENDVHRRFVQTISIDDTHAKLRLLAGRSASAWYPVELVGRPSLTPSSITLEFPDYSKTSATTLEDWNGRIDCVIGTKVTARFKSSELVGQGQLQFKLDSNADLPTGELIASSSQFVPMINRSDNMLQAEWTVNSSGTYSTHAVSVASGKSNDTSKWFAIDALVDQPPRLSWIDQNDSTTQFIKTHQVTELQLKIVDEFAVDFCEAEWQVGQAKTTTQPVVMNVSEPGIVRWNLDPIALNALPGDLISFRFRAVDRNGQVGESVARQWIVSQSHVTAQRWDQLQYRYEQTKKLASVNERLQAWITAVIAGEKAMPDRSNRGDWITPFPLSIDEMQQLEESFALMTKKSGSWEEQDSLIDLTSFLHFPLRDSFAKVASFDLRIQDRDDVKIQKQRELDLVTLSTSIAALEKANRQLFGEEVLTAASIEMESLIVSQQSFKNVLGMLQANQIRDRQLSFASLFDSFLERINKFSSAFSPEERKAFADRASNLRQLQRSMANRAGGGQLTDESYWKSEIYLQWIRQIDSRLKESRNIHLYVDAFFNEHRNNRKTLDGVWPMWVKLLEEVPTLLRSASQQSNPIEILQTKDQLQFASSLISDAIQNSRELEQSRISIDRFHIADLGNARLALINVLSNDAEDLGTLQDTLAELIPAIKMLISSHRLELAHQSMATISEQEKQTSDSEYLNRILQPKYLNDFDFQVDRTRDAIHALPFNEIAKREMQELSWGTRKQVIASEINSRRWSNTKLRRMTIPLEALGEHLVRTQRAILGDVQNARSIVAKYIPRIEQVAQQASEVSRNLNANLQSDGDAKGKAQTLQSGSADLQDILAQLTSSLQNIASSQDLLNAAQAEVSSQADRALASLAIAQQKSSETLDRAVAELRQNPGTSKDSAASQEAVERQKELQSALEEISNSFSDSPNRPQKSEAANPDQDPLYQQAEFFRKLSELSPESILKELEKQLPTRPAMKEELYDIVTQEAKDAVAGIDRSEDLQQQFQREFEQADPITKAAKQAIINQSQNIAQQLRRIVDQDLSWLQQSASRGQQQVEAAEFLSVRETLRSYSQQLAELSPNSPSELLKKEISAAESRLGLTLERFKADIRKLNATQATAIATEPQRQKDLSREAAEWSRRFEQERNNSLQAEERNRTNQLNDSNRRLENQQRNLNQANERESRENDKFNKSKKSENDVRQLSNARGQREKAERELAATQLLRDQASVVQAEAAQAVLDRRPPIDPQTLNSENPHADLAKRVGALAEESLNQIEDRVDSLLREINELAPATPTYDAAGEIAGKEQTLREDLEQVNEQLRRAARHSVRLGDQSAATELAAIAKQTDKIVEGEMKMFTDLFDDAKENTLTSSSQKQKPIDAGVGESAIQSLSKSQHELDLAIRSAQAFADKRPLEISAEQMTKDSSKTISVQELDAEFSKMFGELLSDAEMAHLLDEFDDLVYSQSGKVGQNTDQPNTSNAQSNSNSSTSEGGPEKNGPSGKGSASKTALQKSADSIADLLAQKRMKTNQSPSASQPNVDGKTSSAFGSAQAPPASDVESKLVESNDEALNNGNRAKPAINEGWSKLRQNQLKDIKLESRADIDSPYQESIDAYFRALSKLKATP